MANINGRLSRIEEEIGPEVDEQALWDELWNPIEDRINDALSRMIVAFPDREDLVNRFVAGFCPEDDEQALPVLQTFLDDLDFGNCRIPPDIPPAGLLAILEAALNEPCNEDDGDVCDNCGMWRPLRRPPGYERRPPLPSKGQRAEEAWEAIGQWNLKSVRGGWDKYTFFTTCPACGYKESLENMFGVGCAWRQFDDGHMHEYVMAMRRKKLNGERFSNPGT